jgi:manganese transport protein
MVNRIKSGKPKGKTYLLKRKNKTTKECRSAVIGQREGIRAILRFLGTVLFESIDKIDRGNFTTYIQRSFQFGYKMFWFVILAKSASKYVC